MQIYDSFIEAGQDLEGEDKEKYYTALIEYLAFGVEPQVKGSIKAIFTANWPTLKKSHESFINGKKGGRPKTQTDETEKPKTQKVENPNADFEETQTQKTAKPKDKDKDKDKDIKKELSNESSKESPQNEKPKPKRHKHGRYDNVLLTDTDFSKLKTEFPQDWDSRVERLSEYMASTGKSYKNHLATIRSWASRDPSPQKQTNEYTGEYANDW